MRIVCVAAPGGAALFVTELGHGEDPHVAVWQHGLSLTRPLSATRQGDEIVLTVLGAPHSHGRMHVRRPRGMDPGLRLGPGEAPQVRQRVAAYGVITSTRGVLATEFSHRTHVPGQWGLPGGGVDPGEHPARTVEREVWEETGQHVRIDDIIDIQSDHWIGRAPNGTVEDFHAVRLVYRGFCDEPTDPVVHDVGGTTSDAQWVPTAQWRRTHWTAGARSLLDKHLDAG